jgi:hypothetical protein
MRDCGWGAEMEMKFFNMDGFDLAGNVGKDEDGECFGAKDNGY